jgi:hypothetical protein
MINNRMTQEICIRLEEKGYRGRIASIQRIDDLRTNIERILSRTYFSF